MLYLKKKTYSNLRKYNFNCLFPRSPLVYKTYSRTITIHRGIFPGWALQELSADCCPNSGNLMFSKQIFISETKTLYCLYFSPLNFLPRLFKNQLNYFQLRWKPWEQNTKFEKENRQNLVHTIFIVYFLQTRLFTEKFLRTTTIHPGIFRGRALWADSVSQRTHTIASRDQFKPIRIGEDLVVN